MAARVVCISRTDGALGKQIGELVAARLGFRYVDEQVIERAAKLARVDPEHLKAVEHRKSMLDALIEKLSAARDLVGPAVSIGAPVFAALPHGEGYRATPDDLRLLIRAAIHELAAEGQAVIVAHAASMTLATRTDIVRVLVTASTETRARRLVETRGISSDEATAFVATSDRNRRDYFRRFYDVPEEQPTHYDLVLNTDVLTPEHAAEVIVCAAQHPG